MRKQGAACCSGFQKARSSKTSAFSCIQPDRPGRNSPLWQPKCDGHTKGCTLPQQNCFPFLRAKHAPFFAYPAWKQDMQKILGFLAEVKNF